MGILWCYGSQDAKAQFLSKLINQAGSKWVVENGKELKMIFKKIFYLSIDMPVKYAQLKDKIDDEERLINEKRMEMSQNVQYRNDMFPAAKIISHKVKERDVA